MDNSNILCASIRSYINLGNYAEARETLEQLKGKVGKNSTYNLLKAQLLHKENKLQEAIQLLEKEDVCNVSETWAELGSLYWDLELYDKCLVPFLKVSSFRVFCYFFILMLCIIYLGCKIRTILLSFLL